MCCACGGGCNGTWDGQVCNEEGDDGDDGEPEPEVCEDTAEAGATDLVGDGCDVYAEFPMYCYDDYNTSTFDAWTMCCGCGGGSIPDDSVVPPEPDNDDDETCVNLDASGVVDVFGDDCAAYTRYPMYCDE